MEVGVSLRHCLDFVCVVDTVRNRRPLALHGSVSAFFAHRVRKLLHITQNPQQSLNSTYTSTPIPYPHKPHHKKTPVSLSTTLQHRTLAHHNSKGAKRPMQPISPLHNSEGAKRPTQVGKNSPGWWAGCGCMV